MTMRVALHTRLTPGSEMAYERAHQDVPPELVAAIRDAGATSWTIWRSGIELFHLIDCEDYACLLSALEPLEVNAGWQLRMSGMQEISHEYSPAGADAGLPVVWNLVAESIR